MKNQRAKSLPVLLAFATLVAACGGRAYVYEPVDSGRFLSASEQQSDGPIRVTASVPGREETERIFGIDLYDQGIQPVWLQVENGGENLARYAPVSTDPEYFAPLEVAYTNRRGYSDEARRAMDARFHELAMPRYIEPGTTRSGFVFTHADSGAKGFNVDVFGGDVSRSFTFLLRVPGFEPDYARLDLKSMHVGDDVPDYDLGALQGAIRDLPCCSADRKGEEVGEPINLVLIGDGEELLRALLRSGWRETALAKAQRQTPQFLYDREQDAIFTYESIGGDSFFELRFWKAPFRAGGKEVYVGQARHFFRWLRNVTSLDADVDTARNFAIQKFFYGQAIKASAWVSGKEVIPATSFWDRIINTPYFSDGYRMALWLSAEPVSMFDIDVRNWDDPPRWLRQ